MRTARYWAIRLLALSVVFFTSSVVFGGDWSMWRHDARRSGVTLERLPARLSCRWTRDLPAPRPAWPDSRLQFDGGAPVVVAGGTVFIASSSRDGLFAYRAATGTEKWRFRADGPVRLAPVVGKGRIFFTCDDGFLYCLDAKTGKLLWRFFGPPSNRKVLGNERLISMWPARGGPVLADGKVYFAAGIWPFMGVFIYCLDANTGKIKPSGAPPRSAAPHPRDAWRCPLGVSWCRAAGRGLFTWTAPPAPRCHTPREPRHRPGAGIRDSPSREITC